MKQNCHFVWTNKVGSYNPLNQSYDGAIGLLAESKADAFMRYSIPGIPFKCLKELSFFLCLFPFIGQ